jgi:hypothetical protein
MHLGYDDLMWIYEEAQAICKEEGRMDLKGLKPTDPDTGELALQIVRARFFSNP